MSTPTPPHKSSSLKRRFWVTKAAIENYVASNPDGEKDPRVVFTLIEDAIKVNDHVEMINDGEDAAQVIKISDMPELFALVKDNHNNDNSQFVVVTVMSTEQVEKKWRTGQWTQYTTNFGLSTQAKKELAKVVVPTSSPSPVTLSTKTQEPEKIRYYLLSYRLLRVNGTSDGFVPREYESWDTPKQIEDRIEELSNRAEPRLDPRSVEVFKRMGLGVRIIEE